MRWVYFDIDDTLILWRNTATVDVSKCKPVTIDGAEYFIHEPHVNKVISHHKSGHTVILWSKGGDQWAKRVAERLDIADCVDYFLTKPDFYYDDKSMAEQNTGHLYLTTDGLLDFTTMKRGA